MKTFQVCVNYFFASLHQANTVPHPVFEIRGGGAALDKGGPVSKKKKEGAGPSPGSTTEIVRLI